MSTPLPLSILPLTPSDYPAAALLYASTFHPGAVGQALYAAAQPADMAALLDLRLAKAARDPRNVLLKAERGGRVVGYAWLVGPGPEGGEGERQAEEEGAEGDGEADEVGYAEGTRVELLRGFGEDLEAHAATVEGRHWHRKPSARNRRSSLTLAPGALRRSHPHRSFPLIHAVEQLGTDPAHQRTGVARALAEWGIARARADGLDLHLDATIGKHTPQLSPCRPLTTMH